MRYAVKIVALALAMIPASVMGQDTYHEGWNSQNFLEKVSTCQMQVSIPQAAGYQKNQVQNGMSEEKARNEAIRFTRVTHDLGGDMCFCVYNKYAKENPPSSPSRDEFSEYTMGCKGVMQDFHRDGKAGKFEERKLD